MTRTSKIVLRSLAVVACLALLLVAGQILLVLRPGLLLRNHMSHGSFVVHSAEPIPGEMRTVLDRAAALVSASELYDPSLEYEICLCQGTKMTKRFLLREVHFAAVIANGTIFVTWGDPTTDTARWKAPEEGWSPVRTLSGTLAHEMAHNFIRRRVGFVKERRLPTWLQEGYADVIARDSAIDPAAGVKILLEQGPGAPELRHFPSRFMVDYLIHEEERSVIDLMDDPPPYADTMEAALSSLEENPAAVVHRLRAPG